MGFDRSTPPPSTPPDDPTDLAAVATSTSVNDLSWTDNSSDESGFDIERSLDGVSFSLLDTVPANQATYVDTGLAASTAYYYRGNAYNGAGVSGWSNTSNATTFDPAFIPDAPSNLVATATSSSTIDLVWTDNSANEEGFDIERSESGGGFQYLATVGVDQTTYGDGGLSPSTTYDYQVSAFNEAGSSTMSNVSGDTTFDAPGATLVTVGSITVSTVNIGKGNKQGRAVVVVHDDFGQPVADAVVTGDFSGTFNETVGGAVTDGSGSATLDTSGASKGSVAITFCVTGISHGSLQDFSANPGEVCGTL